MILNAIKGRRSIRTYKSDQVKDELIKEVIQAGQYAPTGKNTRSWEFIVIKDAQMRQKIYELIPQEFLKNAPVLIIPLIDLNSSITPVQDIAVASENMFLQAYHLGLGSVWKNVNAISSEELKKLLGVPSNYQIINIIPLGYPKDPLPTHDGLNEEKIHAEKW